MNSGLLMFVILSCSQPGIIIAFNHKIMQEVIANAAQGTIKYYEEPTIKQPITYSKFWTKLEFLQFTEYYFPFVDSKTIVIKPTSPTTFNAQIPIQMGVNETVELTRYYLFKSHPLHTRIFLLYPGLFFNVDFSLGLNNEAPTISLANSDAQYYIQQKNGFSFYKETKYMKIPYTGTIKSLAYKAFLDLLETKLTAPIIVNAFNQVLAHYIGTKTKFALSPTIMADYGHLKPYYYDSGFWIAEINGTLFTQGSQTSQFASNLPHFDSSKNYEFQMFISQHFFQQGVNLMPLNVNISMVNIGTYIYNVNCTAFNPNVVIGGLFIKMAYDGECDMFTSNYTLNMKFNGAYNFTPLYQELGGFGIELEPTYAQYSNQVINISSGSAATFSKDKPIILSLLEKQVAYKVRYDFQLPLPGVRCINSLNGGEVNVKNGYLEILLNLDQSYNYCNVN